MKSYFLNSVNLLTIKRTAVHKILTIFLSLPLALSAAAQATDTSVQFADKNGNIIADGSTLNLTEYESDYFGDIFVPSGLFIKNITDSSVRVTINYTIISMSSSSQFQICFSQTCVVQSHVGTFVSDQDDIAAGALQDMQAEWIPREMDSCIVSMSIVTYKQNAITKAWEKKGDGPTVLLKYYYDPANPGAVFHKMTLTSNEGGTITFDGNIIENTSSSFDVSEGKTVTITVEPYSKFELISLKINGINVKKYMEGNTFTTDEIDSDVEIVATFDLINPYITITPSAELQTFCSEKNLNLSEVSGLTAYIVTGYKPSANELLLTPVLEVPAGTGVLLKGDVGATYKVPVYDSDYNYNNNLVGVLSDTEVTTGYVFDGVFKAVGGNAVVPANTAYLVLPAATNAGVSQLNLCITDGPAVKGDVNGDSRVDISDVVSLVNIVLGN